MNNRTKILLLIMCFLPAIVTARPVNMDPALKPRDDVCTVILPDLHGEDLYDKHPYSLMYYYGVTSSSAFVRIIKGDIQRWPESIHSVEAAVTLPRCNPIREFFHPIVNVVELAVDFTVRYGKNESTIYELDPFIGFRWTNFIWNDYVTTSFLLGEGLSYASSIPWLERKNPENDSKRLLNYMRVELTLALPSYPRLQLVPVIHHRSGAYGLYGAGNTGSNDICIGLKYIFA